jgi:hypothetical protein
MPSGATSRDSQKLALRGQQAASTGLAARARMVLKGVISAVPSSSGFASGVAAA